MTEDVSPFETLLSTSNVLINETITNDEIISSRKRDASEWISLIGLPTLVIFGTIGNLMSFFVMRRGSLKSVSTCLYMAILALADTGVLWAGAFVEWIRYLTNFTLDLYTYPDCKIGPFLFFFFSHYSSFILSVMSVEKFFALYFPLRTKSVCTVKTAKRVLIFLAVIFIAFDIQVPIAMKGNVYPDGTADCRFVSEKYGTIFYRIDSILYSYLPFAIMTVANSTIIFKFIRAKLRSRHEDTQSTNQALSKSAVKGTTMLITVSVTFIILTAPVTILFNISLNPSRVFLSILVFIQYLNHSINGVLYCIVGSRFRNELKEMICGRSRSGSRSVGKRENIKSRAVSVSTQTLTSGVASTTDVSAMEGTSYPM